MALTDSKIFSSKDDAPSDSEKVAQLEKKLEQLNHAIEELTVLNDLAISASKTLEVEQMLDTIVAKSIQAVKAEQGKILLVTEQKGSPLQTLIRHDNLSGRMATYSVGTHITGWVLKNQQALLIENLATDSRFQATEAEKNEIRSVLCVPIWYKAKIIGVLMVTNKKTHEPFSKNDSRLLSIIAAQSGQLIRNSQLQQEAIDKKRLEHELSLARKIQMGLIPQKEPDSEVFEISSYFNPADEVGGDYFDYFLLGDDKIGVVLADVSGHGASAALIMTMVKGFLHSISHAFASADGAISEINSVLSEIAPKEMFVTMCFLVLDTKNRILRLSNAGHLPMLYYNSHSNSLDWINIKGCALNLTKVAKYSEREISFHSNDIFLLYTDGVTEAADTNYQMFGEEKLYSTVQSSVSESTMGITENLKKELNHFTSGAPQSDDIAFITIKIK